MADVNNVVMIGRLTRDPELKYTQSGIAVTTVGLAVGRAFKNADGENETDFFELVMWRQAAEFCCNYVGKGNRVSIVGRLQARQYQTKEGDKRKVVEIVVNEIASLEPREKGEGAPARATDTKEAPTYSDDPFADQ